MKIRAGSGLAGRLFAVALFALAGTAHAAADFLVDAAWLEANLQDPKLVILEVRYYPHRSRPHDMYTGKVVQHSISRGHIPGAVNVVSLAGVDSQVQKWKSPTELAQLYKDIPRDKTVYAYCHDGFRSSLAWLQLKALGHTNVRIYNGGWGDWGNNLTLPVVEGEQPYDEAFSL